MGKTPLNLLIADDDEDDCIFFKEALDELRVSFVVKAVYNGEDLMHLLTKESTIIPDILFLDLNMPRKTGIECLSEIKLNKKLKSIPVIIYSTSFDLKVVDVLYEKGAHYYIRKPGKFSELKKVIHEALMVVGRENAIRPSKEKFVIQV